MKIKINKKVVVLLVAVFMLGSLLAPTGFAAENLTTIKGWFANIKIFSNGAQVNMDVKPFVIDGTTYVPVRFLSEMLNKDVSWNQAEFRIDITDKYDANQNYMLQEMIKDKDKIKELEAKVKELEAELESKKSTVSNLTDLEKYLNKNHNYYEKVGFDIVLSGSTKNMTVKIYIDDRDTSYWNKLTNSQIKKYVENVVDDILYEFKDAKITGYIENDYTGKQVVDFYTNTKGNLVVDTNYSGGSGSGYIYDLYDMEDYLNYSYYPIENIYFNVSLSWYNNDIRAIIDVDKYEWSNLGSYYQQRFIEDICYEINIDFRDSYISGYVYDGYNNQYFNYDPRWGLEY